MSDLQLELDPLAQQSISDLMNHYQVNSRAAILQKSIALLKLAAHVEKTKGELFAIKGDHRTKILVR